ncbi:Cytochrome P450 76AD1 [Bienertia sinuspersici]
MVIDAVSALNHHKNPVVWLPYSPKWRKRRKICTSQVFATSKLDASQSLRKSKVLEILYVGQHV